MHKEENVREKKDKFRERRENQNQLSKKDSGKECLDFKILKPQARKNPKTEYLLLK